MATARRIRRDPGYTLQALIDALSRRRKAESSTHALEAGPFRLPSRGLVLAAMNRLRNRLIAAFLASTLLPLGATVWITTSLLDRSLRYATTGELDRLSRTLESHRAAVLSARARRAEAGRAGGPDERRRRTRWRMRRSGPSRFERSGRAASRSASACRDPAAITWTTCGGRTATATRRGVDIYSRDLGGVSMEQLSTQLRETRAARGVDRGARPAARLHADAARAARRRRGSCRWLPLVSDRPSHQPADPAAHRGAHRLRRRATGRDGWRPGASPASRRATKWGAPSTPSTTWRISCSRAASGWST